MRVYEILIMFIVVVFALFLQTSPACSECVMSYCKEQTQKRTYIRNNWESGRQIVGDIYAPSGGGRLQIRNKHRQIIGYIESDGSITNIRRQKIGEINGR